MPWLPETTLVWGAQTEKKYTVPSVAKRGVEQLSKTLLKFGEQISAKWIKKTESKDLILNEMLALQPFKAEKRKKRKIHFPTIFYVELIDPLIRAKNKPQHK